MQDSTPPETPQEDPVYVHSLREALVILVIWGVSFAWTVPVCYWTGYRSSGQEWELSMLFGIPSWIFWGVVLPWIVSGIAAILMCLLYIKDDDLGRADDEVH